MRPVTASVWPGLILLFVRMFCIRRILRDLQTVSLGSVGERCPWLELRSPVNM